MPIPGERGNITNYPKHMKKLLACGAGGIQTRIPRHVVSVLSC